MFLNSSWSITKALLLNCFKIDAKPSLYFPVSLLSQPTIYFWQNSWLPFFLTISANNKIVEQTNMYDLHDGGLTQKNSFWKPSILQWDWPIWVRKRWKLSMLSMDRIPSSSVLMTDTACSANSSLDACSSRVFNFWNLANILNSSSCSSNNLKPK